MFRLKDSPLHSSVFALALSALALLVSLLFRPLEPNFYLPFLAAVFASAWYHGRVGGYTATVLSTVAVGFLGFLVVRLHTPWYAGGANILIGLLSFVAISVGATALISGWLTSRSMLTATLSSIGDGVLATNREGRITFLNPVAEVLTGWRRAEAMGKAIGEVLRVIDPAPGGRVQGISVVLAKGKTLFISDTAVTEMPEPEEREEGTRNPLPGSDLDLRRAKALDEAVTVLDGYFAPRAK